MYVGHIHIKFGKNAHSLLHCVGDIMELEVKKDLMPAAFDLSYYIIAGGIIQFHADLYERLLLFKFIKKFQRSLL